MKRIAGALVASGLIVGASFAATAAPAGAVAACTGASNAVCGPTKGTQSNNLHPYAIVSANATYGTWAIGATDPGQSDSILCLIFALDHTNTGPWLSNADSGNLSTAASPNVAYLQVDQTLAPLATHSPPLTCTPNTTAIDTAKATQQTNVSGVHHVVITVATNSHVDKGIKAGSQGIYAVTHPAGSTVSATDLTALTSTTVTNPTGSPSIVTVTNVNPIISKPILDIPNCALEMDNEVPTTGPWASTGTWTGTYVTCPYTAGQNLIKGGAVQIDTHENSAGSGPGVVSVDFVQSNTSNVQLWTQTLGLCKITDQVSRAITCKGDWGTPIPLTIDVRDNLGVSGGAPFGNPAGLNDPVGVTTPKTVHISNGQL